jgi:hypothetical protein
MKSMAKSTIEQVMGISLSGLMVSNCCKDGGSEAPNGAGMAMSTLLGCIDKNTTSAPPMSGLKPRVKHMAGTAPFVVLVKSSQPSASC